MEFWPQLRERKENIREKMKMKKLIKKKYCMRNKKKRKRLTFIKVEITDNN